MTILQKRRALSLAKSPKAGQIEKILPKFNQALNCILSTIAPNIVADMNLIFEISEQRVRYLFSTTLQQRECTSPISDDETALLEQTLAELRRTVNSIAAYKGVTHESV
ncbi:MAG: hypothetical protein BroJett011_42780 [Chloroflexota bacterium]|nr:MAG: hypothetical protein BroJett011_42780 [Chloroflexota bacterium]